MREPNSENLTGGDTVMITVSPNRVVFRARPGQTVMAAANAAQIYWPTVCGGVAICTVCMMEVPPDSRNSLGAPSGIEVDALARVGRSVDTHRLACQAQLSGAADLVVSQRRVRPAVDGDRLPFAANDVPT